MKKTSWFSAKSIIGLALSAGLILVLVFTIEWSKVGVALSTMSYWPLLPCAVLFLVQYYLRALRWRWLLPEDSKPTNRQLFDSLLVGCLGNFVLPLRAGEFIRPYLLTRYCKVSFSSSFVSVVVERFFDLAIVLALFAGMTFFVPALPAEARLGASALGMLALGILTLIVLGTFMEARLLRVFDMLSQWFPTKIKDLLRNFLKDFLDGAAVLRRPSKAAVVIAYSLAIWSLIIALTMAFFWLFQLFPTLEIAVATTVITALAVAAPSSPGFIGVYQVGCIAAFRLFGLPTDVAVAYSIISQLFHFFSFIVLGGYVLSRDNLSLSSLKEEASA